MIDRIEGGAASPTLAWATLAAAVLAAGAFASWLIGRLVGMPAAAPAVGALVVLAVVGIRNPGWALAAFVALTWTSLPGHVFGGLPSPVEVGALVLIGAAAWQASRKPEVLRAVLAIGGMVVLAVIGTGLLAVNGFTVPSETLKGVIFLAIVALTVDGRTGVERLVVALAAAAVFLGLGAVYSVLVHPTDLFPLNEDPTLPSSEAARAAGPFGEANFFALSLAALVPLGLYLVGRGGSRRALGVAAVLCCVAGVLATGSRGGFAATALAVVGFAFVSGDRRTRLSALGVLVVAAALVPVFAAQAESSADRTVSGRETESLVAVSMFRDHPLTGVGPGGYPLLYRDYARGIGDDPRSLRAAHSLPLEIAAEQGIAGLLAWFAAGLAMAAYARRHRVWQSPLGRALILSLGTYAAGSLFLHSSQLRLLFILVGMVLALGAAGPRRAAG